MKYLVGIILMLALTLKSKAIVLENDVTFYLFNKNHLNNYVQINKQNAKEHVNGEHEIVFLVHGWLGNRLLEWYEDLTNAFLSREDKNYTVIQVDWANPANQFYPTATYDTRKIGETVAALIINLIDDHNVPIDHFHICGHSLGAHVAGYAGKQVFRETSTKLARITALDPAGPLFEGFIFSNKFRLHRNDAEIVLVIHTDGGKFGYLAPCGNIDFFLNGGGALQPGCPDIAGGDVLLCSHQRSHQFYIDALENPNTLIGTDCRNYEGYTAGECDGNKQLDLGSDITLEDLGDYYLTTNQKRPYGRGPKRCNNQ